MTTLMKNLLFTIAFTGFSNPTYIGGSAATGFDVADYAAIAISYENGATSTITHEQTFDPDGVNGWFPVNGRNLSNAAASPSSTGSVSGQGYIYPVIGARARFRVSALTVADLKARLAFLDEFADFSPSAVALGAGSSVTGASVASASVTVGTGTMHAKVKAAVGSNLTPVKAGASKLFRYTLRNNTASAKFFKLYDKASAPVVATDVPIETVIIPANGTASYLNPIGKAMALGIAYAITGAIGETDATALAVDDVVGSLDFI